MASLDRTHALYRVAEGQAGYFTTAQAEAVGYSSPLIRHHARRGRLEHVRRGIYRLRDFPPGEREDLVVAWLWSEREGVLSHETALSLHQLSDVMPAAIHLSLPAVWQGRRLRVPAALVLHFADVASADRTWWGPVPVTTPRRTLLDAAQVKLEPGLLHQAVVEALERGLVGRTDLVPALDYLAAFRLAPLP